MYHPVNYSEGGNVMQRMRVFLFSTLLLVALLGVTIFTASRTAFANSTQARHSERATAVNTALRVRASCSGTGCNGQNPVTSGCDAGARTIQTAVFSNSFVELRYSPACGTNWGRVTSKVGATSLIIRTQRIDGLTYTFSGGNFTYAFSAMVYAPTAKARACGGIKSISGCTAYV